MNVRVLTVTEAQSLDVKPSRGRRLKYPFDKLNRVGMALLTDLPNEPKNRALLQGAYANEKARQRQLGASVVPNYTLGTSRNGNLAIVRVA